MSIAVRGETRHFVTIWESVLNNTHINWTAPRLGMERGLARRVSGDVKTCRSLGPSFAQFGDV